MQIPYYFSTVIYSYFEIEAPTHADLLPPCKRFRDSYSPKDSREEHMKICTTDAEAVADLGIGDGVRAHTKDGIGMGFKIAASDIREDEEEFEAEASVRGMMEIVEDLLVTGGIFESTRGDVPDLEEAGQLMASGERAGLTDKIRRLGLENLKVRDLLCIERDRVNGLCHHMALCQEEFRQIRSEWLRHWLTKPVLLTLSRLKVQAKMSMTAIMEMVEMGIEIIKMDETTKMDIQMRMVENLTVKNNDLAAYTQRFQELTILCTRMIPEDEDRIKRDSKPTVPKAVNQRALVVNQRIATCFKCGRQGNFKKDCPKLKNQNHGNMPVIPEARGEAYTINEGYTNPGCNNVTGTFLLNNNYTTVLFNSGADRSFMSTTFSTFLDVIPDTLYVSYAIELADERITETNSMLKGCTIELLGHPFNIDLMPVELGSFDVIIAMDWLANNHAVIVCDEKIVHIPFGDEILIVQGDKSDKGKKLTLSIISCTKTQKYVEKGCQVFGRKLQRRKQKLSRRRSDWRTYQLYKNFRESF
nr:reverse transcriptase domain-containing protein [Tanacetum cinerariifolium]